MKVLKFINEEHSRWVLWLPVAVGLGIVLYFAWGVEPPVWAFVASPVFAALLFLARSRPFPLFVLLAGLLAVALGFNAAMLQTRFSMQSMIEREQGPARITGLLQQTELMPDGVRLTLYNPVIGRYGSGHGPEVIRLRMKGVKLADVPAAGAMVEVFGQATPFSEGMVPGGFDFRRYNFFRGYGGTGWARGEIKLVDAAPALSSGQKFTLWFERQRQMLNAHVLKNVGGEAANIVAALLNGQQGSVGKDTMQVMRASGLAHILSISGLHVSMMGLLVYFPLRALLALIPFIALRFSIKKWAAFAAIIATIAYTFLVGAEAPTLRSALSTSILMFAILVDRRTQSMRLLALAASLVMLVQPSGVMGPSFQMSFAAVLAMVAFYEKSLDQALARDGGISLPVWVEFLRRHALAIVGTSLIATAATMPFTIYHFQNVSIYGVIANMLGVPITSFWIMPCILLTYITAPFGLDAPFIIGAGWGAEALIGIADKVAGLPFAQIHPPAMPPLVLITILMGMLWLCLWQRAWRFVGALPIIIGFCYPLYTSQPVLLVNGDDATWAARLEDGRWAVPHLDKDEFLITQWQQWLGKPEFIEAGDEAARAAISADADGFVYKVGGKAMAMPVRPGAIVEDCAKADVVITPYPVQSCGADYVIDEKALWEHGAMAIYLARDGLRIENARANRGARPWNVGWRQKQRNENITSDDGDDGDGENP